MLFVFDENFSHRLASGIALIESGNTKSPIQIEVTHAVDFMGRKGATDEEIIVAASKRNAIIFTQDKDFKHIKHYYALYWQHEVGVVFFRSSKSVVTYWEIVVSLINRWEDLKAKLLAAAPPAAFQITSKGIQQMNF